MKAARKMYISELKSSAFKKRDRAIIGIVRDDDGDFDKADAEPSPLLFQQVVQAQV